MIDINDYTDQKDCEYMEEHYSARDNIQYQLQSGYKNYRKKGGNVGRKPGSKKTKEKLQEEYKEVIKLLKKGITIKNVATLTGKSTATVARVKKTNGIKKYN